MLGVNLWNGNFFNRDGSEHLYIGMTFAIFKSSGIMPVSRDLFSIWVRGSITFSTVSFSNFVDISSMFIIQIDHVLLKLMSHTQLTFLRVLIMM